MGILIFLAVAVASYYVMSIIQTVLHKDFGHRRRIRAVFSAHAIGHHEDARYNFAVVEFWIDNLMGTRKEA